MTSQTNTLQGFFQIVSEAILRLGESLISRWRASNITQGMITLAAMAWNISLFLLGYELIFV
jgi:hypothetical protein